MSSMTPTTLGSGLSCFSTLTHLLARTNASDGLQMEDALELVKSVPLYRLQQVGEICPDTKELVAKSLALYGDFLEVIGQGETEILGRLERDPQYGRELSRSSTAFTSSMLALMLELRSDRNESLFRYMVISAQKDRSPARVGRQRFGCHSNRFAKISACSMASSRASCVC